MKKIISLTVAIITLVFVGFVFFDKFALIKKNFLENKFYFFLIAIIYIGSRMLDGIKLNLLTTYFGLRLKTYECFGLAFVMPLYNLVFPNAGMLTNALYLKSKYKFKFSNFLSVSLLRFISTLAICASLGIVGSILYMAEKKNFILAGPLIIYVASIIVSVGIFFIPQPRLATFKKVPFFLKIQEGIKGFNEIKAHKKLVTYLVVVQLAIVLLFLLRYYIVLKALSLGAPLISILAITPLTELSNLINLIPANLAIREAVVSGGLTLLGYTLKEGVLVAVVDRAVLLATTLILGTWFFIRLKYSDTLIIGSSIEAEVGSND